MKRLAFAYGRSPLTGAPAAGVGADPEALVEFVAAGGGQILCTEPIRRCRKLTRARSA